jgi:Xaa-Pro aminopeptidase
MSPSSKSLIADSLVKYNESLVGIDIKSVDALSELFIQSRFQKTKTELDALKFASDVARIAHQELEANIRGTESVLAAKFNLFSTECGARLQAYNPIVGCGPHAAVLHFPTGIYLSSR